MRFFILTVNYKSILVQIISNDSIVSIRYLYTSTKDVVFPLVCLFVCLFVSLLAGILKKPSMNSEEYFRGT